MRELARTLCKGRRSDPKPDQQVADEGFAKVQTLAHCDEEMPKMHSDEASAVRREYKPAERLKGLGVEKGCEALARE